MKLDYILIDEEFVKNCFVTSYNNFISDHNSTIARVGLDGNIFTEQMKERITFDKESHLKEKKLDEHFDDSSSNDQSLQSETEDISSNSEQDIQYSTDELNISLSNSEMFRRRFVNVDMETCWLNACLQLVLTGLDHSILVRNFTSELGEELTQLQLSRTDSPLDPTGIKHILVTAEDTRIATRISELSVEIHHPDEIELRTQNIEDLRLNLISGQQCVRDFFLCLNENMMNWPDVFSAFAFKISHSTECCSCNYFYQSDVC